MKKEQEITSYQLADLGIAELLRVRAQRLEGRTDAEPMVLGDGCKIISRISTNSSLTKKGK